MLVMHQITFKTTREVQSGLRKLSMIAGDGRLGQYLSDVMAEHVRKNKALIDEFDGIVKTEKKYAPPIEYPADHPVNLPPAPQPTQDDIDEIMGLKKKQ
jgi:hypothetical protein